MRRYVSLNRIVIINLFVIAIGGAFYYIIPGFNFSFILLFFLLFYVLSFYLALRPAAKSPNKKRSVIGRKRILIMLMCAGSITLSIIFVVQLISLPVFLALLVVWTLLLQGLQKFCNDIIALLYKASGHHHSIGIIGTNEKSLQMANHLHHKNKFSHIKYFDNYEPGLPVQNINSTTSIFSFIDFTKEKGVKELYISASSAYTLDVKEIIQEAEKHCIRVNFIDLEALPEGPLCHVRYINGMPVWQRYNEPLRRPINYITKRAADIIISSLVIFFVLSWLIPVIGILIKLESKGPVFFKQLRSGRDNDSFVCLKFRSMRVNAESDSKQATYKDSRITKVGAFLRKTSLDEFPQFINVWKGEMSIVGPRPHMLRHTEEYSKQIKHYMGRLYLKPGITGWAQVNGYRGEIINLMLMEKRVEYDIEYMENWSLWFDIKIMVLTFWNIIIGEENAY
ncbi:exopolysaccharide biosynthesis polyprenyl glycosylphosphotransferase [Ilyomonas limi]|uniref:Exopolysaccharide biosynthesis polyprenyl glycosylphosphotransferase n=2 Tax=Ilyomonas limi TaxID=2575867 RepID=A0A4V5UUB9_9BACT|nr:exopolysaccharide biosynthesis polyprenyl glycosylphosphotransferase [Ilyomonas limi]